MSSVQITFLDHEGVVSTVDAPMGWSVMEVAVKNDVPGIVGECGGSCACATCHVRVDVTWHDRLPPPSDVERDMLECTAEPATPHSRLGCQIKIGPEIAGLIVHTPLTQV
jgi:2Fe-2S ferredoxin